MLGKAQRGPLLTECIDSKSYRHERRCTECKMFDTPMSVSE